MTSPAPSVATGGRVVALAGGVGGAKLAEGLATHVGDRLSVVVNTGDDCERHGLLVMPDHDTVLYNLAGIEQVEWGWGIEGDTHATMAQLEAYGEEGWFSLGDRDLALHIARTARLRAGGRLTEVCVGLQRSLGLSPVILPMADEPVRTEVQTDEGWLPFQDYFVRLHQAPEVHDVRFPGIEAARPTHHVEAVLAAADLVVIGPSNPIVSIGPILAVPGMQELLATARARGAGVVARLIPWFRLSGAVRRTLGSVCAAVTSSRVVASKSETSPCAIELNRSGPLGEAAVLTT